MYVFNPYEWLYVNKICSVYLEYSFNREKVQVYV